MLWTRYPVVFVEVKLDGDLSIGRRNTTWASLCLTSVIRDRLLAASHDASGATQRVVDRFNLPLRWGLRPDRYSPTLGGGELVVEAPWARQALPGPLGFHLTTAKRAAPAVFRGAWLDLDKFLIDVGEGRRYFGCDMPDDSLRDRTLEESLYLNEIRH